MPRTNIEPSPIADEMLHIVEAPLDTGAHNRLWGSIGDIGTYCNQKNLGVRKFMFTLNSKKWKGQKFRRNIDIHGE